MEMRDILKVTSVGIVSPLLGFRSKQKDNINTSFRQYYMHRSTAGTGTVNWAKTVENLEGATLGYNRNAEAYLSQSLQREYTYS